jgi:uncharacterized membrane protein YccC
LAATDGAANMQNAPVGYRSAIGHSVLAVDRAQLRRWSALRRGALVAATFAVGALVADVEVAALASVASLFVGLQDRTAAPTFTARVMAAQSCLFAGVVLVAGLLSDQWLVPAVILAAAATTAGLAGGHDPIVSRMFGDVMPVAAFLGLSTVDDRAAVQAAAAVLLAGLAQALATRLSVRLEGDLIERRVLAAALRAVADHLDDALLRQRTDTGRNASERLLAAAEVLHASDLGKRRRAVLLALLSDGELLREEAGAVRLRRAHGLSIPDEQAVAASLQRAATALRAIATLLATPALPKIGDRKATAARTALDRCGFEAAAVLEHPAGQDTTATALAALTARLVGDARALSTVAEERSKDRSRRVWSGWPEYLRQPSHRDLLAGGRLGAAAIASLGLAAALHVPHGAWVAATAVALLRQTGHALTTDAIARALGTFAAVALVIPLVALTQPSRLAELAVVLLLSTATFAIAQANEGLYVVSSAAQIAFTRAVVGEDPVAVAVARVEDVALGVAIAIAFLLLLPISYGRRLAQDLADYAEATASWLAAVAGLPDADPEERADRRRRVRLARVNVQRSLELRTIEPWGGGLSPRSGAAVFGHLHEVARTVVTAERAIEHGEWVDPRARSGAEQAAAALQNTAAALRGRPHSPPPRTAMATAGEGSDHVAGLMDEAVTEARAALIAADRGRTG